MKNEYLDIIKRVYGSFDEPNYLFVSESLKSQPYKKIVEKLSGLFKEVKEITDDNCDVSFHYEIFGKETNWYVQLSMVGPFATISRWREGQSPESVEDGKTFHPEAEKIFRVLKEEGVKILTLEELSETVPLKVDITAKTTLYNALFSENG